MTEGDERILASCGTPGSITTSRKGGEGVVYSTRRLRFLLNIFLTFLSFSSFFFLPSFLPLLLLRLLLPSQAGWEYENRRSLRSSRTGFGSSRSSIYRQLEQGRTLERNQTDSNPFFIHCCLECSTWRWISSTHIGVPISGARNNDAIARDDSKALRDMEVGVGQCTECLLV